ncbi:MAG TPA: acetylglutamate kinase [Clostridiaceae bacterium]|nr:acetylglutamate kinase [Clostridiaceae bacterium]
MENKEINTAVSTTDYQAAVKDVATPIKAEILIEALPYIQSLAGKTIVIKYGGNAMINETLRNNVMQDITLLRFVGMRPVVVHGGGPDISDMLEKLSIPSRFENGLRITDSQTIDVAQMTLVGKTNKNIVAGLQRNGAEAIGVSGIDGELIRCRRLKQDADGKPIDIGYVGEIESINTDLINMLSEKYIPVIAPIGVDRKEQSYNINADTVAAEVAAALKAEKLIMLTDVPGVIKKKPDGTSEILYTLVESEVKQLIAEGTISGGMIPKVMGCLETVNAGVNRAHIIDGRIPHSIVLEIFTNSGIGTMIMKRRRPYHPGEVLRRL